MSPDDPLEVFTARGIKTRAPRLGPGGRVFTPRECTGCGALYVWERGKRAPGSLCPRCQPALPGASS